jgi:hypothetical protein
MNLARFILQPTRTQNCFPLIFAMVNLPIAPSTYGGFHSTEASSLLLHTTDENSNSRNIPSLMKRRRKNALPKNNFWFWMILACGCFTTLFILATFPSQDELDMFHRYDLSMWFDTLRLRRAQALANASRLSFLGQSAQPSLAQRTFQDVIAASSSKHHSSHHNNKKGDHNDAPPEGCEATVMILRHCEKGRVREHCDTVGYERSVYLATLFGDEARWPSPSYIFSEGPGHRHKRKKMNFRELETVGPIARKAGIKVDDR